MYEKIQERENMKEITVDGVKFVEAGQGDSPIKIVVLEGGFVYVGYVRAEGKAMDIGPARCLIRWGTTGHLGELADGPLENT